MPEKKWAPIGESSLHVEDWVEKKRFIQGVHMGQTSKAIIVAFAVGPMFGGSLDGVQVSGADAVADYFFTIGNAFGVSRDEVGILADWGLRHEEIGVVLFVARRAGVSRDVVASLRGQGRSWADILQQYGVWPGIFRIAFPPETNVGPLEGAYRSFAETPRASWDEVALPDPAVIALVNIRVLSEQMRIPVAAVLEVWRREDDFVLVHQRLRVN